MVNLCITYSDCLDTIDIIVKVIGGASALILFFLGFRRYEKDQIWKRSEFVAKEIKEFLSDFMVRNTMYMIDWSKRRIELYPHESEYNKRFEIVDRVLLQSALVHHDQKPVKANGQRYEESEVAIRDNFDHFLGYLERFEQFIVAGLITHNEIRPYIIYWINAIAEPESESGSGRLDGKTKQIFWEYIDKYKYLGTQNLFKRYDKNIIPVIVMPQEAETKRSPTS